MMVNGAGAKALFVFSLQLHTISCLESIQKHTSEPPRPLRQPPGRFEHFLAGAAAGAISSTLVAPLEMVRMNLIVHSNPLGRRALFNAIFQNGGIRNFWKGHGAELIKVAPSAAITFYTFNLLKTSLGAPSGQDPGLLRTVAAASFAGITSTVVCFPLEAIRTRLATQYCSIGGGVAGCMSQVVEAGGARALYRGLGASVLGVIPYSGIKLSTYDRLKRGYQTWAESERVQPLATLVMGAVAGATAATACFPLEVVRRRAMSGFCATDSTNPLVTIANLVAEGGLKSLYRGVGMNFVKVVPMAGATFVTYELVLNALAKYGSRAPVGVSAAVSQQAAGG